MLSGFCLKLDKVNLSSQLGSRIRVTSVDTHGDLVVFGASTGTIYYYKRVVNAVDLSANDGLVFLRLVSLSSDRSAKHGPITHLKINPYRLDLLAASTGNHVIHIMHVPLNNEAQERVFFRITSHAHSISQLLWDPEGNNLISGDSSGHIMLTQDINNSVNNLSGTASVFKHKAAEFLSTAPRGRESKLVTALIHRCDSGVVQLDISNNVLLISSETKSVLLDLKSSDASVLQIGSKERLGPFGSHTAFTRIYIQYHTS